MQAVSALALASQLFVAFLFAAGAASKMSSWAKFEAVVQDYRLLPSPLARGLAWLLPPVEAATALALLFGVQPAASLAATTLLIVFAMAMGVNLAKGRDRISCGCFAVGAEPRISWRMVWRNLAIAGLLIVAVVSPRAPFDLLVWINAALCAGAVLIAYLALEALPTRHPWGSPA